MMMRTKLVRGTMMRGGLALGLLVCAASACVAIVACAEEQQRPRNELKEPVFRVAKAKSDVRTQAHEPAHPLDPALELARERLDHIQRNVRDYTATVVKRERIKGEVTDYEYMFVKIRSRQVENGRLVTPFSVYMYFLKPENIKGREVIYVEGENGGKMIAHEGGLRGRFLPSVWLRPDGPMAMNGNRYPITEIGIENLIFRLIEKGERDRQRGECEVTFHKNARINGRTCTLLQVKHPTPRDYFDFHLAQIFIDDELNVPIRYAAYDWPKTPGGRPELIEEYTYLNIKLNVGLTDQDFDPKNPDYKF